MKNNNYLIKMKDGGIVDIKHKEDSFGGYCRTCNYGSYFENRYRFILSDDEEIDINIKKEFADENIISMGDMMKLIINNQKEIENLYESEFKNYIYKKIKDLLIEEDLDSLCTINGERIDEDYY